MGNTSPETGQDTPLQSSPGSTQPYPPSANPDDSAPSPKQEPDHSTGESAPDIPIFLGPSSNDPSPEGNRPPSGSPKSSGYPDDNGRYEYPDNPPCDEYLGGSLINLLSNNGGDGGDASSGDADRQETMSLSVRPLTCPQSVALGVANLAAALAPAVQVVMLPGVL